MTHTPIGPFAVLGVLGWLGEHWTLWAPLAAGAVALGQLLPRGFRRPLPQALALGIVALLAAWTLWIHGTSSTLYSFLFATFAGLAVVAAFAMVVQTNPVYAALCFALVILGTCGLFLLLTAPFLAAATIIVYAGAIIVTFLFVIMLAQQSGRATYDRFSHSPIAASLVGFFFLGSLLYSLQQTYVSPMKKAADDRRLAAVDKVLAELQTTRSKLQELSTPSAQPGKDHPVTNVLDELARELPAAGESDAARRRLDDAVKDWNEGLAAGRLPQRLEKMEAAVVDLREQFVKTRSNGFLRPRPEKAVVDAALVSPLGQSLFGEYLWGVEMAGTLLLVAVVGAISIAPNRAEGNS